MRRLMFVPGAAATVAAVVLAAGPSAAATGWKVVSVPGTGSLSGISADSASDAWAVGTSGSGFTAKPLADHWNGKSWQQVALGATERTLTAVSAASPTDAWAVGTNTGYEAGRFAFAWHWDGSTWTEAGPPGNTRQGVADIGPGNAYAVGQVLAHWTGTGWSAQSFPNPAQPGQSTTTPPGGGLDAVSADGASDVWVVGSYSTATSCATTCEETFALHWDGSSWQLAPMPPVNRSTDPNLNYTLGSVDVIGPADVWAAGYTDDATAPFGSSVGTLTEHWDGTRWSVVPAPSPGPAAALTGIAGNSAASVWAVGDDTASGATAPQTLTMFWDGTSWAVVASPDPGGSGQLSSVSATPGAATFWAAGTGGRGPLVLRNG